MSPSAAPSGRTAGVDPERLWAPPARPARGRPPAHDRAEVTREAVAIADAEGLPAVTMRRLADEVGVGTMTLYTYVPTKEALRELMIDHALGDGPRPPEPSGDWRADLRALAHAQRAVMMRHPWLPEALPSRQTLGPNTLAALEHALTVLDPSGMDGRAMSETFALVSGFVASHVSYEVAQARAEEASGQTPHEAGEAQARYLLGVVAGGAYPRLAKAFADQGSGGAAPAPTREETFDRLLGRLISGLTADPG